MNCVFGDGLAAVIKESERGNLVGFCGKHAHISIDQVNRLLYKREERRLCNALIWGV